MRHGLVERGNDGRSSEGGGLSKLTGAGDDDDSHGDTAQGDVAVGTRLEELGREHDAEGADEDRAHEEEGFHSVVVESEP